MTFTKKTLLLFLFFQSFFFVLAQDSRSQLPAILQKSFFELNYGFIQYPFGQEQLEAGYTLISPVITPPTAFRLTLWGYEFNKYLSGQLTYTQPVLWLNYGKISQNGDEVATISVTGCAVAYLW